jgi:hypothetical protein
MSARDCRLEDPVLALRRAELEHEGLLGRLAPGAEREVAVRHAAVAEIGGPREAQPVRAPSQVLLPPRADELGVAEHDLARLREARTHLLGPDRPRLRVVEALDLEVRRRLLAAVVMHAADQDPDAVGAEREPVPRVRAGSHH